MKKILGLLLTTTLTTTLAAALAFAQTPAPAAPGGMTHDPAQVRAGRYTVEPAHTQVEFAVSHLGFTTYYGRFSGVTGTLQIAPNNPAASTLQIAIPTDSVSTTSTKLDGELKSADWLDAGRYKQITFRSTQVMPKGTDDADVTGDLSLHGVTHPVTLHVHFNAAGPNPISKKYTLGFDVTGDIKRSDFGVTKYVPMVGDDVKLTISGAFEAE